MYQPTPCHHHSGSTNIGGTSLKVSRLPMAQEVIATEDERNRRKQSVLTSKNPSVEAVHRSSPASNGKNIRSRYLMQLGISPALTHGIRDFVPRSMVNWRSAPIIELLKKDYGEKDEDLLISIPIVPLSQPAPSASSLHLKPPKNPRSVSFDCSVTVHQIPMRKEYSPRIRKYLWSDRAEMRNNATRNSLEFASENWDWRQVAEDKDMIKAETGELVHPIHYFQQCNLRQQFFQVMSARRMQGSR